MGSIADSARTGRSLHWDHSGIARRSEGSTMNEQIVPDPAATAAGPYRKPFQLEEATIDEMHAAIRAGEITCVEIVQHYIDRARTFNGVSSVLVTADGAPVPEVPGTVRAGAPLEFPTLTVKASDVLPDL